MCVRDSYLVIHKLYIEEDPFDDYALVWHDKKTKRSIGVYIGESGIDPEHSYITNILRVRVPPDKIDDIFIWDEKEKAEKALLEAKKLQANYKRLQAKHAIGWERLALAAGWTPPKEEDE